jgi:hypothetical protein
MTQPIQVAVMRLFVPGSSMKHLTFQVGFQVVREKNEEGTFVEGNVQSVGGYCGPAMFSFTLDGNRIHQLVIE